MQGVRGREHLSAPARQERVQGVRGPGPLTAPARQEPVQGVRRRKHLRPPAHSERLPGVRGAKHLRAQVQEEPLQGVRVEGACASASARGASARRAARTRMRRCQMGWRSSGKAPWAVVMRPARDDSQSSVASHSRQKLRARWRGEGRVSNCKFSNNSQASACMRIVHEDYGTKKGVCLAPAKHATTHT